MGYYPGDYEEKAERARARERERRETERAEAQAKRKARRRERAERLRAARAAWDEANGAEQVRMLLFGAGRLFWRAARRAWRWLFTEQGGLARDGEGRMRDAVFLGGIAVVTIGTLLGVAILLALAERDAARRDAPKCRAVYEQIARAPDEFTYTKATTLLRELTCTARSVPEPERIGELMGGGSSR